MWHGATEDLRIGEGQTLVVVVQHGIPLSQCIQHLWSSVEVGCCIRIIRSKGSRNGVLSEQLCACFQLEQEIIEDNIPPLLQASTRPPSTARKSSK